MADINFGILDTQLPGRIATAPLQGEEQQAKNAMQFMQVQQAMGQNELAKAKMAEYTRGLSEKNALRGRMTQPGFNIYDPKHQAEIMGLSPDLASNIIQHALKVKETEAATGKNVAQTTEAQAKTTAARQLFIDQAKRNLASNPSDENIKAWVQDAILQKHFTKETAAQIETSMLSTPLSERSALFKQAGAPARAPEATPPDILTMQQLGYPPTQEGYTAFRAAQRQKQLLTPDEEAQRVRIALASRPLPAPRAEAAPTITQIVDPSNPNQMITIDARRYAGGGSGSAGVIGVSGKEPSAALRETKAEAGKTLLADEISNVRNSLNILNANRAIPSTERGSLSNIGSSIAASGVGQLTGRMVGTEAQTERDLIASSKLRLSNAIKQASGMTAAQLNSNVELQTMLNSISNPAQSIETNLRNLDNIEKAYVNVTPPVRPSTPTGASLPAPTAPVDMSAAARAELARRAAAKR